MNTEEKARAYDEEDEEFIDLDTLIQQRVDALADITAEQKHTPKFKVGDWITNGKLLVGKVTSFDGEYYHYMCDGLEQPLHVSNAHGWHIWSIADAKDGDVLAGRVQH